MGISPIMCYICNKQRSIHHFHKDFTPSKDCPCDLDPQNKHIIHYSLCTCGIQQQIKNWYEMESAKWANNSCRVWRNCRKAGVFCLTCRDCSTLFLNQGFELEIRLEGFYYEK